MQRRVLLALTVFIAGCSKQLTGPVPVVEGVDPDALCTEQLTNTLTVSGSNFAPALVDSLTKAPYLALPSSTLTQELDLAGASATGGQVEFSGVPGESNADAVAWESASKLSLTLAPMVVTTPGLYALTVTSPAGKASTKSGAVLAVPPPTLTSLSQDLACLARDTTLTLSGDLFVRNGARLPSVTVGTAALVPTPAECRALPGGAGYEACRELGIVVPAGSQSAGTVAVTVTNPAPLACVSTAASLTWVDRPRVTSVQPLGICSQAQQQVLTIAGENFLSVDGTGPVLTIGTQNFMPTLTGCAALTGPTEVVQQCTGLTLSVPQGTFAPGTYPVQVTNPAPADCASSEPITLVVRPPPVITDVAPRNVCSGLANLTLTGTGFLPGASVTVDGITATRVTVNAMGTSAVAEFSMLMPGGPLTVRLDNGDGCGANAPVTITVIPGPQLFFVDPPVAFNGITIQATAYGTGFTGSVMTVSIVNTATQASTMLQFTTNPAKPGQVQLTIPAGTPAGTYDVLLTDGSSCGARLADGLRIVDQTTLTLATPSMTPQFGFTGEQTPVTIDGLNDAFQAVPRVYLNPTTAGPMTVAAPIGAVSFLTTNRLTGLVPTTALPVGSYDLIVVNPDGTVGVATSAFRVVAQPVPSIASLSPGSVPNSNPTSFTITGADFRMPAVTLSCVDGTGAALATNPTANVTASTATSIDVSFNASIAGVACVVRVTNGDDLTFSEFSALVITNPAQNLYPATTGPTLLQARRSPVVLGANATAAARFLHVIGGDDGATPLDTIETSALDRLGVPGAFVPQREKLTQPRTHAAGAAIGRWLYVAGGSNDAGVLDTVERAVVLDPADREEVTDLLLEVGAQGLDAGTWYYRVAPVMTATDAFNPSGENLPSDPFPVRLPDLGQRKLSVTVSWRIDPGAASYRVYRSTSPGATVGTEELVAEVMAPATSYLDVGSAPLSPQRPLPVGSTGRWQALATLGTPREGPGVSWGLDPGDATRAHLYVVGGRQSASAATASYEFLTLTLGAGGRQTPAMAFTPGGGALGQPRWQLSVSQATNALSSRIPAGTTYLYALSGTAANDTIVNTAVAAPITAGGQLGTVTALSSLQRAGYGTMVAGNLVFAFGGAMAAPDNGIASGEICGAGVMSCGPMAQQVPPGIINWNAGQTMLEARFRLGATLSGAFIYVAGGSTQTATATTSTEYRLW